MSFPTLSGDGVEGMLLREPQVCLGPAFAGAQYNFFVAGTGFATPANVYQDGALTNPFPITGFVQADGFGRFAPIYLDGSITYGVQAFDSGNNLIWQQDPYVPQMSTNGFSTNAAFGLQINPQGEVTLPAPAAGGSQITLKLSTNIPGQACLQLNGATQGQAAVIVNNSVTTGAQTAIFTAAANKPGPNITQTVLTTVPLAGTITTGTLAVVWPGITSALNTVVLSTGQIINNVTFTNGSATFSFASTTITGSPSTTIQVTGPQSSTPSGWLPVIADGVLYYTPVWHGDQFSPYVSNPTAVGEVITGTSFVLGGNGATTVTGGSATPSGWFSPLTTNIGSSYFINVVKTAGPAAVNISVPATTTVAPSGGAYVGGNLTANWNGTTASTYTVQLSTGQLISGCTFTNGSAAFVTPSTAVNTTPTTAILVGVGPSSWVNITNAGLTMTENSGAQYNAGYSLSTSITGTPVAASGTISLVNGNGAQGPAVNGAASLVLAANGTATLNGVSISNWFLPTTTNAGANFWINISRTGGTGGVNFSAAQGAWTSLSAGLTIGLTGGGQRNATGTYQIAANSSGTNVVNSGTISLTASGVNNTSWSGTAPLLLGGDGTSKLNGVANTNWFSPTTANTGSGYWVDITRTSGTAGINFSAAQGSWTNITNSGLSITLSGTSGVVGTATATGSYGISNSATGSPVLGSGTITLNVTGLTILHVYTTGTAATETIPTGTSNVKIEGWAGGGAGGAGSGVGCLSSGGGGGGAGGYSRITYSSMGGQVGHTYKYTVGAGGIASAGNGGSTTVTAGTVTGFSAITCNGGVGGGNSPSGTGGAGGTATNAGSGAVNTTGGAGTAGGGGGSGKGATGTTGNQSGDGSPYGSGRNGGFGSGSAGQAGQAGAVVFFYS